MAKQMSSSTLARKLSIIIAAVLMLLPFHALISTWAGSNFGHLDLFRIWKELLLVALSPWAVILLTKDKGSFKDLGRSNLVRLIIVYSLLQLLIGVWSITTHKVNASALIYGLIINLRFIWFFVLCAVIARHSSLIQDNWQKILIIPALPVIGFGILQKLVLPLNFLGHFGYGDKTIPAYQTVDSNVHLQRIQSTLRGANPLGAYLLLPLTAVRYWVQSKTIKYIVFGFGLIAIFYTYSRSAWIGLILSLATSFYLLTSKRVNRRVILAVSTGLLLTAIIVFYGLRNNQSFQDTLFHTSTTSSASSSNAVRFTALSTAANEVISDPLGEGPGTAGPASARNNRPTRIAENYYIQIAQEVGVFGLALFLSISWLVIRTLWRLRNNDLAKVLLASFVAISFINLVSHAWTDDTLSLIWWGLAGVAVSPAILQKRDNTYVKQ